MTATIKNNAQRDKQAVPYNRTGTSSKACQIRKSLILGFTYSFICQGTSTRRTEKGPFRSLSQHAPCYYQSNHSKVEAISLNALPKDRTSELAGMLAYTFFL